MGSSRLAVYSYMYMYIPVCVAHTSLGNAQAAIALKASYISGVHKGKENATVVVEKTN